MGMTPQDFIRYWSTPTFKVLETGDLNIFISRPDTGIRSIRRCETGAITCWGREDENNHKSTVGSWTSEGITLLPQFASKEDSMALGLNSNGSISEGMAFDGSKSRPVIWTSQGITSLKASNYVHSTFLGAFETSLKELEGQQTQMNLRDLLCFANLYEKLSTESMHAAFVNGYGVGDDFMDTERNLFNFIKVLRTLSVTVEKQDPTPEQMQNLVEVFSQAQNNLAYILTTLGGSRSAKETNPEFKEIKQFLKDMKSRVLAWDKKGNKSSGTYQSSPNSKIFFRGENGINKYALGSNSSLIYPNSESDEDEESTDEEA